MCVGGFLNYAMESETMLGKEILEVLESALQRIKTLADEKYSEWERKYGSPNIAFTREQMYGWFGEFTAEVLKEISSVVDWGKIFDAVNPLYSSRENKVHAMNLLREQLGGLAKSKHASQIVVEQGNVSRPTAEEMARVRILRYRVGDKPLLCEVEAPPNPQFQILIRPNNEIVCSPRGFSMNFPKPIDVPELKGLTHERREILMIVASHMPDGLTTPELTQELIARGFRTSRWSVAGTVSKLEKKGWLVRTPELRTFRITLSEKARKALARFIPRGMSDYTPPRQLLDSVTTSSLASPHSTCLRGATSTDGKKT
jgi:DNA-binding MarR family transcriptional regulator